MVNIWVFITGEGVVHDRHIFTSCAVTEHGRWIAGAVSQDRQTALERCHSMAERKAPEMVTGQVKVSIVEAEAPCIERALYQALLRMP